MPTINELRQNRAKLVAEARALSTRAEGEKRDMNAEERAQFDKIMDVSLVEVGGQIEAAEKQEKRMKRLADEEATLQESAGRRSEPNPLGGGAGGGGAKTEYRYKVKTNTGREITRSIPIIGARSSDAYNQAFRRALTAPISQLTPDEARSLQADSDIAGGFLQSPQVFVAQLIQAVDDMVFMRQLGTVLPPIAGGQSMGIPTREADVADADWTTELATGSEDTTMTFGKRELKPHPIAKLIKISKTLLRSSGLNAESITLDRLAYKMGITQEKGFLTGSGAQQPLGVFTASADGVSTARDVSTGNSTTAIGADGLIEAKYTLKVQYQRVAQWLFHRDAVKQIAKLKDGDGQYLWRPGLTAQDPDKILNMPLNISEYAPNTFTTGLYVGMLADFSKYWIVDSLTLLIQVLLELYAATNQNGYIARTETDGQPVLAEAFARVKLA